MPLLEWMPLITANTERAQKAAGDHLPGPRATARGPCLELETMALDLASDYRWAIWLPNGSPAMRSAMTEFSETAMAARV